MRDAARGGFLPFQLGDSFGWIALSVLLVIRVAVGAVILRSPERTLWPDSDGYLRLARALVHEGAYQGDSGSPLDLMRTPGYPVFLALTFRCFGESLEAVLYLQLLMGTIVGMALFVVGKALWSRTTGFLAAWIYLLTPNAFVWSLAILSDTLFTLLFVLAILPLVITPKRRTARGVILSGLIVGCATLVRPIGLLLVPLWSVLLVGYSVQRGLSRKRALVVGAAFALSATVILFPWAFRNLLVWDRFTISSITTWNLGRYQAPAALARAEGITLEEARTQIPTSRLPRPGDAKRYLKVILEHPIEYLVAHAHGTWLVLSEAAQPNYARLIGVRYRGSGVISALRRGSVEEAIAALGALMRAPQVRWLTLAVWLTLLFQGLTYLSALKGILSLSKLDPAHRWLSALLILSAVVFILSPGPVGNGRFRLPAEPVLAVVAAIGVTAVVENRLSRGLPKAGS